MPGPQLIVLDVVGSHAVLPAKMHQQDGCPQHLQRGYVLLLLVPVEKGGKAIDSYSVARQVGQPGDELEPCWGAAFAQASGDEEEVLQEEATQGENTQLPLVPPLHCLRETHRYTESPFVLCGLSSSCAVSACTEYS